MNNPVLVVMAAGMGSRYGGLKQIDPVGAQGEAILDYSLYDAHEAGFQKAVIIIKKAIEQDFMDTVGQRLKDCPMEITYAYQELDKCLPQGFSVPGGRTKPWGTSHAVLCASREIGDAPFAVINSDDYYGKGAFRAIYDYLQEARDAEQYRYAMVGYRLGNTVTDSGSVSRGICSADAQGRLVSIVERTKIEQQNVAIRYLDGDAWIDVPADTPVSMNMWGFTPSFLRELALRFPVFLEREVPTNPLKCENYLPMTVAELLQEGKAQVRLLRTDSQWYGITYAEDKPKLVSALTALTQKGLYPPTGLWK